MNFKKLFGALAVSVGMLLTSYAPVAAAGCLEKPGLASLQVGVAWLGSSTDFSFKAGTVDTTVVASVATTGIDVDMTNDNFNWYIGFDIGYVNPEIGFGVNALFQWDQLELQGDGALQKDTITAPTFGIFANIDYHSLATSGHDPESSVGFYAVIGVGTQYYYDVKGAFDLAGNFVDNSTTAGVAGTFTSTTTFSNASAWVFAGRIGVGIEFLVGNSGLFSINATALFAASADDLSGTTASTAVVYDCGTASNACPATADKAFKDNTGSVVIPQTTTGIIAARFGYSFGTAM